jgi:hypothetical protein
LTATTRLLALRQSDALCKRFNKAMCRELPSCVNPHELTMTGGLIECPEENAHFQGFGLNRRGLSAPYPIELSGHWRGL